MSDSSDARLRILVQYIRDEAEAKAALADMDGLKTSAHEAGEGVHGAGEDVKYFNTHGREMHKLIHELDHILPGTGLLMRSVFHPEALGIAALVLGIGLVHKAIEEYKKKLEEAHEAAVKADFAEGMEAVLEATRAATEEQETYIHNLDEIKRGEHGVAAEMGSQLQLIAAIKAARQEQAEAEKTLALAKLKEDEIMHRVSTSDAIIQKGDIEKKFVEDKNKAEQANFKAQQQERMKALDEASAKQTALETARDEAKQKVDDANRIKLSLKDAPKIEEVRKAQEAADAAAESFESAASAFGGKQGINDKLPFGADEGIVKRQEEARAAQHHADLLEARFKQAQQAGNVNGEGLQADLKEKEKAADDNAKAMAAARDALNNANRNETDPAVRSARAATEEANIGTIDSQTKTQLMQRTRALQKEFENKGGGMTPDDARELLEAIREMGTAFSASMDTKITMKQLKAELDALKRVIESKGK